jgi:hypothetical protein
LVKGDTETSRGLLKDSTTVPVGVVIWAKNPGGMATVPAIEGWAAYGLPLNLVESNAITLKVACVTPIDPLIMVITKFFGGEIALPTFGRLRGIVRTVVVLVKKVMLTFPKIALAGGEVGVPVVDVPEVLVPVEVVLLVVFAVLVPMVEVVVAWAEIEATNNNATKVRTNVNEEEAIPSIICKLFDGKREKKRV